MNLKKEQTMYTVLLIVGIAVFIGGIVVVRITGFDNLIGATSGLGGVWTGVGIMNLFKIKNQPKKYEEQMIGQNDERNIAIRGYAGYATFITTFLGICLMASVFIVLDYTVPLIIAAGLFLVHFASFLLFAIYYSKKI
jgi:hypothetical protein